MSTWETPKPSAHGRGKTAKEIFENKEIQTRQQKDRLQVILIGLLCIIVSVFDSYHDTNNGMIRICVEDRETKIKLFRQKKSLRKKITHVDSMYRTYVPTSNQKDLGKNLRKTQKLLRMTGRGYGPYVIA